MLRANEKVLMNVLASATVKESSRYALKNMYVDEKAIMATTGKILVKLTGKFAEETEPGFYLYVGGHMIGVNEEGRFPNYQDIILNDDCEAKTYRLSKDRTLSLILTANAMDNHRIVDTLLFAKTFKALEKLGVPSVTIRHKEKRAMQMELSGPNWDMTITVMPYDDIRPD